MSHNPLFTSGNFLDQFQTFCHCLLTYAQNYPVIAYMVLYESQYGTFVSDATNVLNESSSTHCRLSPDLGLAMM